MTQLTTYRNVVYSAPATAGQQVRLVMDIQVPTTTGRKPLVVYVPGGGFVIADPPAWVDLAVPEGTHRPRIDHPPVQVHVFRAGTFGLGRTEVTVGPGARFAITDAERTVVDVFRLRHRLGEDLAAGGLRRYLRRPRAKPGQLLDLAGALRVRTPVLGALRVLQE